MDSAAAPSDEFDSTRETGGSARAGNPPAASPVQLPPPASPAHTHSANESLLDKTRYTRFKDQSSAPPCFLCLCQQDEEPSIFGTPSQGIISRVTAYWQTHYANQRPRRELAEACMELIHKEQEHWSFDGPIGDALAGTTALSIYEHFTEHLMAHESTAEDRILADLAHNASALQSLMYTAGTKGKREVDKEICKQHCAVASLFLRGVAAKRARREKESR